MRRNRTCTACKRGNGKRSRIAGRIPDCQNRVRNRGCDNRHTHNLRSTGSSSDHRVCQILAVQGQDQLTCFIHTDLKQNLIGSDLCQIK